MFNNKLFGNPFLLKIPKAVYIALRSQNKQTALYTLLIAVADRLLVLPFFELEFF